MYFAMENKSVLGYCIHIIRNSYMNAATCQACTDYVANIQMHEFGNMQPPSNNVVNESHVYEVSLF